VKQTIHALPKPVVHSFPYFLFLLLLADIVLLLLQTVRELHEYRTERTLLMRAQAVNDAKKNFLQLVSHYLRTPITIVVGSIDLLGNDPAMVAPVNELRLSSERMRDKVESLISQIEAEQQSVETNQDKRIAAWRQPGLYLPILLIGVVWFVFEWLVARASNFSVGQVEHIAQAITFTVLALILYQSFRYLRLRKRDRQELQTVITNEQAVTKSRDELIDTAVTELGGELRSMENAMQRLRGAPNAELLEEGVQKFHEMFTEFSIAGRLRGTASDQPPVRTSLSTLLASVTEKLRPQLDKKGATVNSGQDTQIAIQEPELFAFVLMNILDNAVAYSEDKSEIDINASASDTGTEITVADHGQGISSEKLPLLFQPFSKAEGAEVFTHEGMGFSLYLDRLIMTYLGGEIGIDSKQGRGTTVTLSLP
jgi:signal transduction histidine kinase